MDGEIQPGELAALLEDGAAVRIIDVRQEAAYQKRHIPDSEVLPLPELPEHIDRLDGADHVVTVCPHGDASVKAARLIAAYEGLAESATVQSLAGGLAAWDGPLVGTEETGTAGKANDAP